MTLIQGAVGGRTALRNRVRRLLEHRRDHGTHIAPLFGSSAAVALVAVVGVFSQLSPLVVFLDARVELLIARPVTPGSLSQLLESAPESIGSHVASLIESRSWSRPPEASQSLLTEPGSNGTHAPAGDAVSPEGTLTVAPTTGDTSASVHPLASTYHVSVSRPIEAAQPSRVSAALNGAPDAARAPAPRAPWVLLATAGVTVGSSAQQAGMSVGGFFADAGKAVAAQVLTRVAQ
jgi:hypothetical protein